MPEPLSMLAASGGLAKLAYSCGSGLWTFKSANQSVNQDIQQLHAECDSLGLAADGFSKILHRPEFATFHDAELWDRAAQAIENAEAPLQKLEKTLQGLRTSHREGWSMGDLVRVLKKDFKIDSVATLRVQLHSHLLVLNGIMSELGLLISGKSHHTILQELSELRLEIRAIQTIQRSGGITLTPQSIAEAVTKQMNQKIEPQPQIFEFATRGYDQLPDTPLNDGRVKPVAAQTKKVLPETESVLASQRKQPAKAPKSKPRQKVNTLMVNKLADTANAPSLSTSSRRTTRDRPPASSCSSPIHIAIAEGSDVNKPSEDGAPPSGTALCKVCRLYIAVTQNKLETVRSLTAGGVDVNDDLTLGESTLHEACRLGFWAVAATLVEAGAKVNTVNMNGDTPLHLAAEGGNVDCTEGLCKAGAKVNAVNRRYHTSIHLSALRGHPDCIEALIAARANVNAVDDSGKTPLHLATWKGHTDCTKALIAAGAKVNTVSTDVHRNTPLHSAAQRGAVDCTKALIQAGAKVNATDSTGDTPLHEAAWSGDAGCVRALIEAGAKLNATNEIGGTPLFGAAQDSSLLCMEALIEAGADVNVFDGCGTPLDHARLLVQKKAVKLLLENGAVGKSPWKRYAERHWS